MYQDLPIGGRFSSHPNFMDLASKRPGLQMMKKKSKEEKEKMEMKMRKKKKRKKFS